MPKYPSAHLNLAFTHRKAKMSRTCYLPTQKTIDDALLEGHLSDPESHLDAMIETMVHGMKVANDINPGEPDPVLVEEFPRMFKPIPGRQLWGWADIASLSGGHDLRMMAGVALRPSATAVTPLHALTSVHDKLTDVNALAAQFTEGRHDKNTITHYIRWQDFGQAYNDHYFITDRHHIDYTPPTNSKRNGAQHYAVQIDPAGRQPIQAILMRYPPVWQELNEKMDWAYQRAKLDLQSGPDNKFVKETHRLIQSHTLPPKVARIVFGQHGYNGPTPWDRLYDKSIHPTEHAELMVARQVTQNLFHPTVYSPQITLAISLLTGASPASFVLAAIERLERTASTFMTEGCVLKLVDLISLLPEPRGTLQIEQREELCQQLEDLAAELSAAQDRIPPNLAEEVYDMLHNKGRLLPWGRV